MGKKTDQIRRGWTDEEIATLMRMRAEGVKFVDIAPVIRRTPMSIQHKFWQQTKARAEADARLAGTDAQAFASERDGLRAIRAQGGFCAFSERVNVHGERVITLPLIWPEFRRP